MVVDVDTSENRLMAITQPTAKRRNMVVQLKFILKKLTANVSAHVQKLSPN